MKGRGQTVREEGKGKGKGGKSEEEWRGEEKTEDRMM